MESLEEHKRMMRERIPCRAYLSLSDHDQDAMREYIEEFVPVGSFLEAVLSNDLCGAIFSGNHLNVPRLPYYILFLARYAPTACWGSAEKYQRWLQIGKELRELCKKR